MQCQANNDVLFSIELSGTHYSLRILFFCKILGNSPKDNFIICPPPWFGRQRFSNFSRFGTANLVVSSAVWTSKATIETVKQI